MLNKILVPIDGSDTSYRAMDFAMRMGKLNASAIEVIHIDIPYDLSRLTPKPLPKDDKEIDPLAKKASALDFAKRKATVVGYENITFKELIATDIAERICSEAESYGADLVVMGNKGTSVLMGFFMGSVSMKVAKYISCPVTIVK